MKTNLDTIYMTILNSSQGLFQITVMKLVWSTPEY